MGGYILFEMWRKCPERVAAFIFCNTRADPETEEGKVNRFKTAERVLKEGTAFIADTMIPRVMSTKMLPIHEQSGKVTVLKEWMQKCSPKGIAQASIAMATRQDSNPILSTISVPSLIICGGEDPITGESVMKPMKDNIKGVKYALIQNAGHLAPFDSPQETVQAISDFVNNINHK